MEKLANADYPVEEILRRRWSPRAFSDRMVEPEKLQSLFEAARWAPSSFNEQPWSFIVATKQKQEEHALLLSCLVEKNQQWARLAPVLMVSVTKLNFEKTGKPNRHAFHDVGLAMGNMLVQATRDFHAYCYVIESRECSVDRDRLANRHLGYFRGFDLSWGGLWVRGRGSA